MNCVFHRKNVVVNVDSIISKMRSFWFWRMILHLIRLITQTIRSRFSVKLYPWLNTSIRCYEDFSLSYKIWLCGFVLFYKWLVRYFRSIEIMLVEWWLLVGKISFYIPKKILYYSCIHTRENSFAIWYKKYTVC